MESPGVFRGTSRHRRREGSQGLYADRMAESHREIVCFVPIPHRAQLLTRTDGALPRTAIPRRVPDAGHARSHRAADRAGAAGAPGGPADGRRRPRAHARRRGPGDVRRDRPAGVPLDGSCRRRGTRRRDTGGPGGADRLGGATRARPPARPALDEPRLDGAGQRLDGGPAAAAGRPPRRGRDSLQLGISVVLHVPTTEGGAIS